jgi:hypothetical protein
MSHAATRSAAARKKPCREDQINGEVLESPEFVVSRRSDLGLVDAASW